jgi:nitrogen regulatory protein P-II 2
MKTSNLILLTIIAEDDLESRLVEDLRRLGARGHTICKVRGEGAHGWRGSEWEGENIKVEVIVDAATADAIGEHISSAYFPKFAVILYLLPVQVLRESKFTNSPRKPDSAP